MFLDRRRRARRFIEWKVGLFSVAAVLALAGMYLEARWMTGLAIVVLASAMLLRFLPGGGVVEEHEEEHEEEDVEEDVEDDVEDEEDEDAVTSDAARGDAAKGDAAGEA